MSYQIGAVPRLAFATFSDAALTTEADPTAITLHLLAPDGTETTEVWPGGDIVRDALGEFHYDVTGLTDNTKAGHYAFHWVAAGAVADGEPGAFDVRPLYDPQLVSLADVREHFESDEVSDAKLQGFIDNATELVEAMVGAVVRRTVTDEVDASGGEIILPGWPVLEVTAVSEWSGTTEQAIAYEPTSGGTFTSYGFRFKDGTGASGILVRTSSGYGARWTGRVVVTYTVGQTQIPERYRMAAKEAVRLLYTKSQGMGATEYPVSLSDYDMGYLRNLLLPSGGALIA